MSLSRFVRTAVVVPAAEDPVGSPAVVVHRRRRSHPRPLVARTQAPTPRVKKTFDPKKKWLVDPRLTHHHDFGDGRHALEFETPMIDMMLYHDRGVTIAEWVTADGRLISLLPVGDC